MEILAIDTSNSEGTVKNVYDDHLIYDKVRREIVLTQRYDYIGHECYALNLPEGLQNS